MHPYFLRLASRILSARAAASDSALAGSVFSSTASLTALFSSASASPMPGTGGGKCRSSIWVASAAWSVRALNSADSRTCLRAGT